MKIVADWLIIFHYQEYFIKVLQFIKSFTLIILELNYS
jgi:hypothetical protein